MKRLIAILTTVLMFPSTGFAMYQTPLEVLQAVQKIQYEPQSFSLQFSLDNDEGNMYGSVEGVGNVAQNLRDMELDAKVQITIDIPDVKATVNAWIKMSQGIAYIKAESSNPDIQSELTNNGLGSNMWIRVELDEFTVDQEMLNEQDRLQKLILPVLAEMFTLKSSKIKNGYEYTLELKPNFIDALKTMPTELLDEFGITSDDMLTFTDQIEELVADFQKNLVLKIKVWTNTADAVMSQKAYMAFSHTEINASVETQYSVLPEKIKVIIPAERLIIDANSLYSENVDVQYEEDWNDEWSADSEEDLTWEEPTVDCWSDSPWNSQKPSRRSIAEYKKHCE